MKDLKSQFVDWLATQDAEAVFDPYDSGRCAGFQFLKALGYPVRDCWVFGWRNRDGTEHSFPEQVSDAIFWACTDADARRAVTFGALRERLMQP